MTIRDMRKLNNDFPQKKEGVLRIMTYNVKAFDFNGNRSARMVLNVLREVQPDVVGLQEFNRNEEFLRGVWNLGYKWICYKEIMKKPEFGNAIISKIKMDDCQFHFYKNEFREPRGWIKIKLYNGKLVVFNTHLDVFDKTGKTRLGQIEELLNAVKKEINADKYVVVMGDFNSMRRDDYTNEEIENMKFYSLNPRLSGGIHPLDFKVSERIDDEGILFEAGKIKFSVKTGKRVDFIYLSNNLRRFLKGKGTYVFYSEASDHIPLFCDL